jgi:hypothetical protein
MSGKFDFNRWMSGIDQRLKGIDEFLKRQFEYSQKVDQRLKGLAGADDRSVSVLQRGIEQIEAELTSVKARYAEVLGEQQDLKTIISGIEGTSRHFEGGVRQIDSRLRELAYHVGVYDEVVQGVAIRPQRAVPATRMDHATGTAFINEVKVHTKTFWLASTQRTITIPANGSAQVSFVVPPEQNQEGDMEIYYLEMASATSTSFRVRLNHTGLGGKFLMNAPVHALGVFGNMNAGPQPFSMYETVFLQPNMELIVELQDFSGAPNTVELVAHGRKFIGYAISGMSRRGLINVFARNTWPFWLTTDTPVSLPNPVANGVQFSMSLERQFHAELAKLMRFGTINGVPAPVDYRMTMSEGASGNLIIDNVPVNTVAGSGNFPIAAPEPYLALRGTQLSGVMTPTVGIANQVTDFVWHGRALPLSFGSQRVLEPLLDGRSVQLPPASNKDLSYTTMVSE